MRKRVFGLCLALLITLSVVGLAGCTQAPKETIKEVIVEKNVYIDPVTLTVVNGSGSGMYKPGTEVTITPDYDSAEAFTKFSGWRIGTATVSTEASHKIKVDADTTVTAVFGTTISLWDGVYPNIETDTAPASFVVHDAVATDIAVVTNRFNTLPVVIPADAKEKTQVIDINSAEALAWFRETAWMTDGDFAHTYSFWYNGFIRTTVNINCDIDMQGFSWKGFSAELPILDGVTIDGKGHTILNMLTPATMNPSPSKGGGKTAGGGFISVLCNSQFELRNLSFLNASVPDIAVNGTAQATAGQSAVVIGFAGVVELVIDNVHINNADVDARFGHKSGGMIGRLGFNESATGDRETVTIKNSSIKDLEVLGKFNLGGYIGIVFSSNQLYAYNKLKAVDASDNGITIAAQDRNIGYVVAKIAELKAVAAPDATLIATWEGILAEIKAHEIVLKFENNTIENCKIFKRSDDDLTNAGLIYNYGPAVFVATATVPSSGWGDDHIKIYDNALVVPVNAVDGVKISGANYYTNSKVQVVDDVNGPRKVVYAASVREITNVIYAFSMDTEVADKFDKCAIYVHTDLDLTAYFADNADQAEVVLPETVIFYLVNGATVKGLPETMAKASQMVEKSYGQYGQSYFI